MRQRRRRRRRRTGGPVEILGERTETARVFANPSGTRTLEQHVMPVRAKRDGECAPIDTRLTRGADGAVVQAACATAPPTHQRFVIRPEPMFNNSEPLDYSHCKDAVGTCLRLR